MNTRSDKTVGPLRRHEALKPLSREHHDGLLLCWKIRKGLAQRAETKRIAAYAKYFFTTRLWPHFAYEEIEVFPLLGNSELVREAKEQHRRLGQLFLMESPGRTTLDLIQQLLEKHIRFEERILFAELQEKVPDEDLSRALAGHDSFEAEETWTDKFWT